MGRLFAGGIYRVSAFGREHLPVGGFLLLPNHLTWVDAIVLQLACPRPIRFVISEEIYNVRWLTPFLRTFGAVPISTRRAKDAVRAAAELIAAGEIVCIFPEGELSRSGMLLRLKRGYELIARAAKCPVVPVWLDQLWGSIFSFQGGRFFFKWPKRIPYPVTVAFGKPIASQDADIATVREQFLALGEFSYQQRPGLRGHLGEACLRGLKRHPGDLMVTDGLDHSTLTRGSLLAAAIALSRHLRRECPDRRIAIVLPPGRAGLLANLAVLLADKVPANLNFTAGRAAIAASIELGGLRYCLSATPVQKRLPDFPWPDKIVLLDELLPSLKRRIISWRVTVAALPAGALARLIGLPRVGDRREAFLLFTSGSSGMPKGVPLTHRNLLANVSQFSLMLGLQRGDSILGSLPFFHSFGATVTILYPMMEGVRLVTYPSPLEVAKNAALIARYKITVLLATPTFLRGYLRKAEPAQLATLKLVVTGAEKLPQDLADAFRERFGHRVMQGYGLTETSPVVSVNLPEPVAAASSSNALTHAARAFRSVFRHGPTPVPVTLSVQPSSRESSTGKLATGIAAQIRHAESGARLSLHETGMLWLRGPNIFEGYLDAPERSAEVLEEGWFKTGDLGRFDEDGFLFIEGRLSRFSKIAGEMVPHETVEARILEVLGLEQAQERECAITAIPDEAKGEALVLLTSRDIDAAQLRAKLTEAGLPNLWIPKRIRRVEKIPILGSGKLDLGRCQELAREETPAAEG